MTGGAGHIQYRPLHAPREDRTALVEPPLDQVDALVAANQELRKGYAYDFCGHSLPNLAGQAREELVAAARRYTSAYRDVRRAAVRAPEESSFSPGINPTLSSGGLVQEFCDGGPGSTTYGRSRQPGDRQRCDEDRRDPRSRRDGGPAARYAAPHGCDGADGPL